MNDRELQIIKYILNKIENDLLQKKNITEEIKELSEIVENKKDSENDCTLSLNYYNGIESRLEKNISSYETDIRNILEYGDY